MWPFKKKPVPRDWRLVKTLEAKITWSQLDEETYGDRTDSIYYYLYEDNKGKRKVEWKHTNRHGSFFQDGHCATHPYYLDYVYPWQQGMHDSSIPDYWEMADGQNNRCVVELYGRLLRSADLGAE